MSNENHYSLSLDGERFSGRYATIEEALKDADSNIVFVGLAVAPPQPETFWAAEDWLEHVSTQDPYCGDWADNWDDSTHQQRAELEDEVRKVLAAWLDRHGLRPRFWDVKDVVEYVANGDGEYLPVTTPSRI